MGNTIHGPRNPLLGAALQGELEKATQKLNAAVETVLPHRNALLDAYNKADNAANVSAGKAEQTALEAKKQELKAGMRSAWQDARATILADETKGVTGPTWWGGSAEISAVESTIKLLTSLSALQGVPLEKFDKLLGSQAAQEIATWQALHEALDFATMLKNDVGSLVPVGGLEKLRDELAPKIDGHRKAVAEIYKNQRPMTDMFPGAAQVDAGFEGKTVAQILRATADKVDSDPGQSWIRAFDNRYPNNRSPNTPSYASNMLRRSADNIERDGTRGFVGLQVIGSVHRDYTGDVADLMRACSSVDAALERGRPADAKPAS